LQFREATRADLPAIIELLADDELGATRESTEGGQAAVYERAFEEIAADPNNQLIVAIEGDRILGTFQLTFIANLSLQGGKRALIEGVRVKDSARGRGIGREMFLWAIEKARERGCHLLQLTSNKQRADAFRFYESLGFQASHEGFKLYL
jgi:GNAT superfamily N-acetyltransferase